MTAELELRLTQLLVLMVVTVLGCLMCARAYADEFIMSGGCYPKEVQAKFLKHGLKLDLSGNDRTRDSFAFIENRGQEYKIFTYKNLNEKEMLLMLQIITGADNG